MTDRRAAPRGTLRVVPGRSLIAVIAVVALALAASCSSDDEGAAESAISPTGAASSSSLETTASSDAADYPTDNADAAEGDNESSTSIAPGEGVGAEDVATTVPSSADTADDESTSTNAPETAANNMPFSTFFEQRQQLVGQTVEVVARAFFIESCPPPGTEGACVRTLYMADPSRNDLLYGQRAEAVVVADDGTWVSCTDGSGDCAGWQDRAQYRLVATVAKQVLGGREVDEVQLNVMSRTQV